ncbi:MAG: PEP-CTERM sorting domain-containing protein [Nitrosomonadaceae bacterium]|nr:PEP-CTERM sorting domain-containing protein [Nitrosomonadaceae bacterium]
MKKSLVNASLMLCLVGGTSAHAAVTLYTSQVDYLAAVGATTTFIDFAGSPALTVNGDSFSSAVTFGTCDLGLASCSSSVFHNSGGITDTGGVAAPNFVAAVGGHFTNPVHAFAFNYISGGMGSIELNGSTIVPVGSTTSGFVGIVSTDPIDGFVGLNYIFPSTGGRDRYFIDDFYINPVPEPGAWAMLLAGLTLLGFRVARTRQ